MNNVPTRREFAQALAVLGLASAPALAQVPDAKTYAAALETVVRYRFGRKLSDEQVRRVVSSLVGRRLSGDYLKRFELDNGEDPVEAFRADIP